MVCPGNAGQVVQNWTATPAMVHGLPECRRLSGGDVRQWTAGLRSVPAAARFGYRTCRPGGHRAGLGEATVLPNGQIRVAMGPVDVRDRGVRVRTVDGAEFAALDADVGNLHA